MSCPWKAEQLLCAAKDEDEFFRYCAGVAYQMFTRFGLTGGLDIRITSMDLPLRKGVSSSAAVCIVCPSPACPPQAMFAEVINGISSASCPVPSPRSQFKSMSRIES